MMVDRHPRASIYSLVAIGLGSYELKWEFRLKLRDEALAAQQLKERRG